MAFLDMIMAGGFTGLLGNLVSTVFSFINQKQKNKHDVEMRKLDMDAMEQEAKINIRITEAKVAGDIAKAEQASFNESVAQNAIDKLSNKVLGSLFERNWTAPFGVLIAMLFGLVDFVKALIRPGITLYMTVAVTTIYMSAWKILEANGNLLDEETARLLFTEITGAIIYVFVSSVLWWFGDRRVAKVLNRQNGWK